MRSMIPALLIVDLLAGVIIGVPALAGLALGAWLGSERYHWSAVYPRATAPSSK